MSKVNDIFARAAERNRAASLKIEAARPPETEAERMARHAAAEAAYDAEAQARTEADEAGDEPEHYSINDDED